jgi:DNA topoisomerase-1
MKLVVVESPSKAKTINKYLGNDYLVISSVGHIIDLPKSKLGVDVEHNYEPQYETIPGKEKVIKQLKSEAKDAEAILLATDPDREGEAISWHIQNVLKGTKKPISRIVFHEITKGAIEEALKHPREVDQSLVDAQQARRVLDRLVGYTLSPLLWKKIRYGLSAGRVQSVALRLIVDRERERLAFDPEEYWSIKVLPIDTLTKPSIKIFLKEDEGKPQFNEEDFILELKKINSKKAEITKKEQFEVISKIVESEPMVISDLSEKTIRKHPYPPFTTSTFQQSAVNTLGMTSKSAMRAAQKLYEAGLITYMRTDSFYLSKQAIDGARDAVKAEFGAKYVSPKPNVYKTNSKSAQEAHEAIRPTDFKLKIIPKNLGAQEEKVYDLIRRRALATQMADAVFTQKTMTGTISLPVGKFVSMPVEKNESLNTEGLTGKLANWQIENLDFGATAQKCEFQGWLKLYKVNENQKLIKIIESLKVDSKLYAKDIYGFQHFTEPPARFTEASLIKALEKFGIGRPSTYASIVSVIMQRTYVEKDGKYFYPTDMGFVVTDLLKNHFETVVDIDFTAKMESDLDKVAEGELKWQPMVGDFYVPLKERIKIKDKEINKEDLVVLGPSDEKCDICGKPMVKKLGKYGTFLSCSDFPTCKGIKSLDGTTEEKLDEKAQSEEFKNDYKPAPKTDDGREFALKKGRFGEFWAHPDYPKVKDARPLEYTDKKLKELFGEAPKASDGKKMVIRSGRFGHFWAHPDYPKVKELQKVKKRGVVK